MSRGPGTCQRAILAAIEKYEGFFLVDLLAANHSKTEYNALNRAAIKLADSGMIGMFTFTYAGGPRTTVCRHGASCPKRADMQRLHEIVVTSGLSVGEAVTGPPFQHLSSEEGRP